MKVRLASKKPKPRSPSLAILPCFDNDLQNGLLEGIGFDTSTQDFLRRAVRAEAFGFGAGQVLTVFLPSGSPFDSVMVVGIGPPSEFGTEVLRSSFGQASRHLPDGFRKKGSVQVILNTRLSPWKEASAKRGFVARVYSGGEVRCSLADFLQAMAEGWIFGSYRFVEHKTDAKRKQLPKLEVRFPGAARPDAPLLKARLGRAEVTAEAVTYARDLVNTPANALNPTILARHARVLSKRTGISCQILDEKAIRRERMGALLGVAQGSDTPPCFIVLQYKPPSGGGGRKRLVFVGKAVTFDSGGLSIKPAKGMESMKMDMSGGAAVLAALGALGQLKPKVPVVGLIPAVENMISGRASRPGDVLESRAGLTIEVVNTDAEGRLILADALDYAAKFRPTMVVDVATLTGACVVALGHSVSGLMANDREAADRVRRASETTGERVWELPLFSESFELIRSDVADIKNSGGRYGGALSAAAFLARFVEGVPWCHLDIAGTAWCEKESGYLARGATGAGVRLLVELAMGT